MVSSKEQAIIEKYVMAFEYGEMSTVERAEILSNWISSLRSGDYQQGIGQLRKRTEADDAEYCCLGVLCDQFQRVGYGQWMDEPRTRLVTFQWNGERRLKTLAGNIVDVFQFREEFVHRLIELNDDQHIGFEDIADEIVTLLQSRLSDVSYSN